MKIELRAEPGASSQSEINPFAAPIVQDLAESPDAPLSAFQKPWNLHLAWALAVLFNLPIPVMFGTTVTDVGAPGLGMVLGVAIIYLAGIWCCKKQAGVMWRLIVGSVFTAISQIWPVAQILTGLVAMGISKIVFDFRRVGDQMSRISEVVSTTILTGLGLIAVSLFIGAILTVVFRIKVFDIRPQGSLWKP